MGHRPSGKQRIGYEYVYLYAAINPHTGDLFSLLMPNMTKACFEVYLNHFDEHLKEIYADKTSLMIVDGAGSHQADLIENRPRIDMVKLPPYCPELNPVERFFEELRKWMSNKVYDTIEQVEQDIEQVLAQYYNNPDKVKQLTLYPYIRGN